MNFNLTQHPIVDGLYVVTGSDLEFYFCYVSYDSSEGGLIFEREGEVVTARVKVSSEQQLQVWLDAFHLMSIDLERVDAA